ncbi:hypothetical protein C8R46DRAFT_1201655, partial [Mycena filopes]
MCGRGAEDGSGPWGEGYKRDGVGSPGGIRQSLARHKLDKLTDADRKRSRGRGGYDHGRRWRATADGGDSGARQQRPWILRRHLDSNSLELGSRRRPHRSPSEIPGQGEGGQEGGASLEGLVEAGKASCDGGEEGEEMQGVTTSIRDIFFFCELWACGTIRERVDFKWWKMSAETGGRSRAAAAESFDAASWFGSRATDESNLPPRSDGSGAGSVWGTDAGGGSVAAIDKQWKDGLDNILRETSHEVTDGFVLRVPATMDDGHEEQERIWIRLGSRWILRFDFEVTGYDGWRMKRDRDRLWWASAVVRAQERKQSNAKDGGQRASHFPVVTGKGRRDLSEFAIGVLAFCPEPPSPPPQILLKFQIILSQRKLGTSPSRTAASAFLAGPMHATATSTSTPPGGETMLTETSTPRAGKLLYRDRSCEDPPYLPSHPRSPGQPDCMIPRCGMRWGLGAVACFLDGKHAWLM